MSRAKEAGGDRVEIYAAHMHADVVRRLDRDRQRPAAGRHQRRADPGVPAGHRAGHVAGRRGRGAGPLVARGPRSVAPREFLGAAEETNPDLEENFIDNLLRRNVDGIIFSRVSDESRVMRLINRTGVPVVVIDRAVEREEVRASSWTISGPDVLWESTLAPWGITRSHASRDR